MACNLYLHKVITKTQGKYICQRNANTVFGLLDWLRLERQTAHQIGAGLGAGSPSTHVQDPPPTPRPRTLAGHGHGTERCNGHSGAQDLGS